MIEKISQSFMKNMRDYIAGHECGLTIKHQYIDGKLLERKSKEMAEGSYFEFCLTGASPKGGKIPIPLYSKDGKSLLMDYKRAHVNADRVKAYMVVMGLKMVEIGKRFTYGRFEGTIDLVCECTKRIEFSNGVIWNVGDMIVIDIKYSGLLYNRWEKHGWEWSDVQKEYHGTQAKHYSMITKLPFYFLVVSNTNLEKENELGVKEFDPTDMRLFRVPVDEHIIEQHVIEANKLYDRLKFESEVGLVPRPALARCSKCPLKGDCEERAIMPQVEDVDLTFGI